MVGPWVPSGTPEALVAGASSQGAGLLVSEWPWENTGLSVSYGSSSPPLREDSLTHSLAAPHWLSTVHSSSFSPREAGTQ